MDPARPGFKGFWFFLPTNYRLDEGDASFVDVIHTARGFAGLSLKIGHADFYPNDGVSPQPACKKWDVYRRGEFYPSKPKSTEQ